MCKAVIYCIHNTYVSRIKASTENLFSADQGNITKLKHVVGFSSHAPIYSHANNLRPFYSSITLVHYILKNNINTLALFTPINTYIH